MGGKTFQLESLLEPVILSMGCELWGVDYHAQGKRSLLRIYIDKADGVVLQDCEKISRQVSAVLDVEDPIASEYTLEVSSPGMDRPLFKLSQYHAFIGEQVNLRLRIAFDGRRKFSGVLSGIENDEIILRVEGDEEYVLPYELIDKANIVSRAVGL